MSGYTSSSSDDDNETFAERNGAFIISMMSRKGHCHCPLQLKEVRRGRDRGRYRLSFRDIPKTSGLYIFYLTRKNKKDPKHPIYVGVTKQPFRRGLQSRHLNHISEFFIAVETEFDIYVVVLNLPIPVAYEMKYFFLDVFDFIENSTRYRSRRKCLDVMEVYTKEQSVDMVLPSWKDLKREFSKLDYIFRDLRNEE